MAIAVLGDPARASPGPRGAFTGNQAEETHQLPRCVEADYVAELSQDGDDTQDMDTPETDQGVHQRSQGPGLGSRADLILKIGHPPGGLVGGIDILLKDDLPHRIVERLISQPARVGLCPTALARIDVGEPEEKRAQALAGLCLEDLPVLPGPGQIAHGFLFRSGTQTGVSDPDRCSRASIIASRRSVFTRSVAPRGTSPRATTTQ